MEKAFLLLEDGTTFWGRPIGKVGVTCGEICFNTGMTGYQEIYTDPSYSGQIVVNTSAHIGNYGTKVDEVEADKVMIKGLVVKSFSEVYSRFKSDRSLQNYLEDAEVTGIADIDTRKLVRHIRQKGVMNVIIGSDKSFLKDRSHLFSETPNMDGLELSSEITTDEPYFFGDKDAPLKVAVLDLGIKKNILRMMGQRGIFCKIFPANTPVHELLDWKPNGVFLSNGPGDPSAMGYAIQSAKELLKVGMPMFGICLGHQVIANACGLTTFKMHHGHRGLNHPVKNIATGKSEITSQNHGFAVKNDLSKTLREVEITHLHLNDGTIAGLRVVGAKAFSVQYHPEASPGPHDSRYLFDDFVKMMTEC